MGPFFFLHSIIICVVLERTIERYLPVYQIHVLAGACGPPKTQEQRFGEEVRPVTSVCESISLNALINERSRCSHMTLYATLFSEARNVVVKL